MKIKKARGAGFLWIIASLVACVVLAGATLALFNDSQVNTGNRVKFGTLDVDLKQDRNGDGTYESIKEDSEPIFSDMGLWEPGKTEIVYLQVENNADLTLKYSLELKTQYAEDKSDENAELDPITEAFEYAVIRDVTAADRGKFGSWDRIKRQENVVFGDVYTGYTEADVVAGLLPGSSNYIALALHMREDARVDCLNSSLSFDINLLGTQSSGEADSEGTVYDRHATFDGQTNLLLNGDFEEVSGSSIVGWTLKEITQTDPEIPQYNKISLAEETGVHGLYSVNILMGNSNTKYPRVTQNLSNYQPGTDVTISGWVKDNSSADKAYPAVKVEFTTASGKTEAASFDYKDLVPGEWTYFEETVTIPVGTTKFTIAFRLLGGKGMVSFDDLAVYGKKLRDKNTEDFEEFQQQLAVEAENRVEVPEIDEMPYWDVDPDNQILNGDFEQNVDTVVSLENWEIASKFQPCTIVKGGSYNGSDCISLKIEGGSGKNPYFSQTVYDVIPLVQYRVTYKYKVVYGPNKPTIKFEAYTDLQDEGAKGDYLTPVNVQPPVVQADGQWHEVSQLISFVEGTKDVSVLARMLGTADGEILIDDLSMVMESGPVPMVIDTQDVFFYTDARDRGENAEFVAKIDTGYYPVYANAKVEFAVYKNKDMVWRQDANAQDGVAKVQFPLSILENKAEPYAVIISLYNDEGKRVCVLDRNIYVYDRPEYLKENGVFQAEGEDPFYPVLGYHVRGAADLEIAAEAGINLIQMGPYTNADSVVKALDNMQANGVKGMIAMYPSMYPAGSIQNMERTIRQINDERVTNHPALFGYCIMDEPFLNASDPIMDMENSYRIIRKYDTKHPIMCVENMEIHFHETYNYVDIIITDAYCQAQKKDVWDEIDRMRQVCKGKPVYTLIQTYQSNSSWPTPDDARNNLYQAFIAGAKSLGYYSVSDATHDSYGKDLAIWQAPDGGKLWKALTSFMETELPIAGDHFFEENSPMFNKELGEKFWYYSWVKDGEIYMVVLGMVRNRNNDVEIPLTSQDGSISIGKFTGEVIAGRDFEVSGDGTLKMQVRSIGATLIKITPTEEVDFSSLEKAE